MATEGRKIVATATVPPETRMQKLMLWLKKSSRIIRFNQFLVFLLLLHHFYKYRSFQCIRSGLSRRNDGDMKISTLVAMDADSKYGLNIFFHQNRRDYRLNRPQTCRI